MSRIGEGGEGEEGEGVGVEEWRSDGVIGGWGNRVIALSPLHPSTLPTSHSPCHLFSQFQVSFHSIFAWREYRQN